VVCRSVCLSVCHTSKPYKNGCTDRNAVWAENSNGPGEPLLDGVQIPHGKGKDYKVGLGLGLGLGTQGFGLGLGLGLRTYGLGLGLNFKAKSRPNPTLLMYHQR